MAVRGEWHLDLHRGYIIKRYRLGKRNGETFLALVTKLNAGDRGEFGEALYAYFSPWISQASRTIDYAYTGYGSNRVRSGTLKYDLVKLKDSARLSVSDLL